MQLLDRLVAPATAENVRALSAWIEAEFNRADLNNPLATTRGTGDNAVRRLQLDG